jgi:hypothetical protein
MKLFEVVSQRMETQWELMGWVLSLSFCLSSSLCLSLHLSLSQQHIYSTLAVATTERYRYCFK